ncbi:hypothetical protein WAX46_01805 [Bacillus sp. FJAT-53060]|uniref:hypothetical protein n=1 Tax=Bacillus sp. FJAT-53060 TaxID=3127666 RepID=UPI00301407C4
MTQKLYDFETIHRLSFATLHGEFAAVMTTEQLMTKWANHERTIESSLNDI